MPAALERTSATKTLQLMTDHVVPAISCISLPPYTEVAGYGHVSITVQFSQDKIDEPPVDLGVSFAFDAAGTMASRRYVSLEANLPAPQKVNMIEVAGIGACSTNPHNRSNFTVYLPVLAPFVQVFVYNRASIPRRVSVWVYLSG
jgi:hypothetical protein